MKELVERFAKVTSLHFSEGTSDKYYIVVEIPAEISKFTDGSPACIIGYGRKGKSGTWNLCGLRTGTQRISEKLKKGYRSHHVDDDIADLIDSELGKFPFLRDYQTKFENDLLKFTIVQNVLRTINLAPRPPGPKSEWAGDW